MYTGNLFLRSSIENGNANMGGLTGSGALIFSTEGKINEFCHLHKEEWNPPCSEILACLKRIKLSIANNNRTSLATLVS